MHRLFTFPFWGGEGHEANIQVSIGSSKTLGSLVGGMLPCVLSEEAFHMPMPSIGAHAGEAQGESGWVDGMSQSSKPPCRESRSFHTPPGEDDKVLIGLRVGQNKHSVQGLGEQRQLAGTRGVSCKCLYGTHMASCGHTDFSGHQY